MSNYLDPKVLMAIKDLSLAAKKTVDGFQSGLNKSRVKGSGMEFSQYRSYEPGDDLRSLDWKLFARSDRYYIRESEVETSISIRLLIDNSNSMNHADDAYTKLEFAKYLAASLAYLAHSQGDAIGLYRFEEKGLSALPARRDPLHLHRLVHELEIMKAGGGFTKIEHYRPFILGNQSREVVVFLTDLYQQEDEIIRMLELMASLKHEVLVLQIMAANELKLDFEGYTALEDLETGQVVSVDPTNIRKQYQENLNAYLDRIRTTLLDKSLYYRMVNMRDPVDAVLRDFLLQREKTNR
jgi:uncharacterized protein (DUF58 family)